MQARAARISAASGLVARLSKKLPVTDSTNVIGRWRCIKAGDVIAGGVWQNEPTEFRLMRASEAR
ncbi:MAG: hypothetical protein JWO19_5938 [Bryobacterales bacterium]|nr:hypothetical protein [Bryobacterales bacterium]